MIQNFQKTFVNVEEGAVFRRTMGGSMTEIAEVIELGRDRMGIAHVRFTALLLRGNYAASAPEQRTLSLESFATKFRERVQKE